MVLWTRLCGDSVERSLGQTQDVLWQVSRDPMFEHLENQGRVAARAELAYCVHVFLDGLLPDTEYFYRFKFQGEVSSAGRTRTLPSPGSRSDGLRMALTSCQEYSVGYFNAYVDLVAQKPDLVFQTGDYIYETAPGAVRPSPFPWDEAFTLDQYRALYALYRSDQALQQAHAVAPWVIIWDDHEVVNDWGAAHYLPSPYNTGPPEHGHLSRVEVGRRAYLEHMPLRASAALYDGRERPLYDQVVIGDLLELNLLDVRSYRDLPVCNGDGSLSFTPCEGIDDPRRSLLGGEQEAWFFEHFGTHGCVWSAIGQTTVFAPFNRGTQDQADFETDSWDNYPANRQRILKHISNRKIPNVISLAGNIHAYYLGTMGATDPLQGESVLISEIVTTSISAGGGGEERYRTAQDNRALNPDMKFFDNRYRGYTLVDVGRERIDVDLRVVDDVTAKRTACNSLASFSIAADDGEILKADKA